MLKKWRFAMTCGLLVAGVVAWGAGRWQCPAAAGGPIAAAPSTQPNTGPLTRLRLTTFNIHSGIGLDDREDLCRTADVLRGADLIALQEVAGERPWRESQGALLAERLGLSCLFSPTETHFWYPVFGNAILTRYGIDSWSQTPLPKGFKMANRQMIHLVVPFGQGKLNVLVCHMGKKSDRAKQFKIVGDMFKTLPEPAILMGDLNTRPYDRMMQDLLASANAHDLVGERIAPVDRVDFIIGRGVKCADAGLIKNSASDHPAAWAEIEATP